MRLVRKSGPYGPLPLEEVLDDNERDVVTLKYLNRNKLTLGDRKGLTEKTIGNYHKSALDKLAKSLMFVDVPEITNLDEIRLEFCQLYR